MPAKDSQYNSGSRVSGALSHVYVQYPPLRCNIPGSQGLFYDDGNKLLLCPTYEQVFSWKAFPFTPLIPPASNSFCGGTVLSIRYCLDSRILAVQRSNHEVELYNRETGDTFHHRCRLESESILGFFWTDYPNCDIVFIKTSGLDLFSYDFESKSLHLVETKKLNVSWYVYTHESRLLLLASGMQCNSFIGFQLSSVGLVRLPKFEMTMAKSEVNCKPVLAAEDVHIVTVYGRIYCIQVDRVAMQLHSYRFYRDAVVQQGSLPIYSKKVAVSVVDNVLLVHQLDAKVVILYDIFADSRAPISAPLPLLLRGFPKTGVSLSRSGPNNAESSEASCIIEHEAIIYGEGWTFLAPDLVCDVANGFLWKIHLDLEAISTSCSEVPSVVEFLQRRKLEANKAKQLCLTMVRSVILERRPVSMVSRAMDVIITSYSHSLKMGNYHKGVRVDKTSPSAMSHIGNSKTITDESTRTIDTLGKAIENECSSRIESESPRRFAATSASDSEDSDTFGPLNVNVSEPSESQVTSAAISPDEMYTFVFSPIEEEMAGDTSYLVAIIIEFLRSANVEKIKVNPNHYVLTIQLLARNQRFAELGIFIINKILEPSKEVALQLLDSGRYNSQTRKLGLDMLRQLSLHHDYILLLVQDGYYVEALRYARKTRVNALRPSLFLDSAVTSNDSQHLAAVLRFLSDFIPGFNNTSDHSRYYHILNEMNTSVVG